MTGGRGRFGAGITALSASGLLMLAGCSNPGEGTVTISPEARARLRGQQAAQPAKTPTRGKAATAPVIDVREKQRRKPEG